MTRKSETEDFKKVSIYWSIITDEFIPPFNDVNPFIHIYEIHFDVYFTNMGFPGGSADKESACNAGDLGLIPGLGRSTGEGKGYHSSILSWRIPWTV